ncbi:MAG: excinuclease ABC subunit UvrC [Eubacteriales bacterium]|nr:excinuclease ABC subunit UvrC [Eubacteriales bacterium]
MNPHLPDLRRKAAALPLCPGVYLMKDESGKIIYVGKSRKLKNRVSSYFLADRKTPKTQKMVSHVADFDYILCDGEMEALTLENTLIKRYTPHYNIRLKDAKSYPYIKVTAEDYPRVVVTRERRADRGKYFGPYSSSAAAHEAADTVTRVFSLPTCRRVFPRDIGKERPCLYAQMGRCAAPCTGTVPPEAYRELIRGAVGVLSGNVRETREGLMAAMIEAAEGERFELAAHYRDAMAALDRLSDKQKVVGDADENRDVLALFRDDFCMVLAVLSVREGKLIEAHAYLLEKDAEDDDLSTVVTTYYGTPEAVPREVLLSFNLPEETYGLLSDYLSEFSGHRVEVRTPQRGKLRALVDMAMENARDRAAKAREHAEREETVLVTLARLLGLEVVPDRIEMYDISEIGQEHITAAMIVTDGTAFRRSDYRTFRMKTLTHTDDYAAMRETLSRRLAHIGDGTPSLGEVPDLILLDGGVGQVHAVMDILPDFPVKPPVFGLVKDDYHKTRALTDGENEISIATEKSVYAFLYRLQEEVHRVAVRATMGAKTKTLRRSALEDIPGIGAVKAKKLLARMKYTALKTATVADMTAAGIPASDAARVYAYFHKEDTQT